MEEILNFLSNFLTTVFAGVLSILVVLALERQKRPQITFDVAETGEIFDDDGLKRAACKWLKVKIKNDNITGLLALVYDRDPALLCRASIVFKYLDGHSVFGRTMPARWDNTPEPKLTTVTNERGTFAAMPHVQETYDIPPGEYTTIALVYRAKGEIDCYGWNNESYLYGFKHPDWKLEKNRYIAELRVTTRGHEFISDFMIFNDGQYNDFRLEMVSQSKN